MACITAADPGPGDSLETYREAIQNVGLYWTSNGSATYTDFECANKSDQASINIPPGKKGSTETFTFNMVTNEHDNEFCELTDDDEKYGWPGGCTYNYDTGPLVFQTCAAGGEIIAQGTPEDICGNAESYSGQFLWKYTRATHEQDCV